MATGEGAIASPHLFVGDAPDEFGPDALYAEPGPFTSGKRRIGVCVISRIKK